MFVVILGIMAYLFIYLQVVSSGIKHKRLQDQKTTALNRYKDLKIDYSDMIAPRSVEQYATDKLGLVHPSEKQFRYIK